MALQSIVSLPVMSYLLCPTISRIVSLSVMSYLVRPISRQ